MSILVFAGCSTTSNPDVKGELKERGVYTTLAMAGEHLDLPASGYLSQKTFAPGQTPAAVVVGYGYSSGEDVRLQPFDLQLVEADGGNVIYDRDGSALPGKATIIDLPIRKSGNYRLKLIINNSVYDTWDFTVNREDSPSGDSRAAASHVYATGIFSVLIVSADDDFSQYGGQLINSMLDSVTQSSNKASHDIFAQVIPGKVTIQFNLDANGQVNEPQIVGNTLTPELGQFFLHALQAGAPYKIWSDADRAKIGTTPRAIKVDFYYK